VPLIFNPECEQANSQQAMHFASNSNENEFVSLTIRKKCNVFKNIFKKRAIIGKHARSEAIQPF
jgi:hypothetical protein